LKIENWLAHNISTYHYINISTKLKVTIDENAGFCFGVVNAIGTAEEELAHDGKLYCLGDIVHNSAEVERLRQRGLRVIDHEHLPGLTGEKVLIRAHGEPPSTYEQARQLGIRLVDATCPMVLALQKRIRKGFVEMSQREPKGQVVIFGKPGHAEVVGLCGQTDGSAIVVSRPDDMEMVDFARPIRLFSQTTQSKEEYAQLVKNIEAGVVAAFGSLPEGHFVAYDTICSRVANRAVQLEQFAKGMDVVLFVSGRGSSNGHYLYEYCRRVQPNTRLVTDVDEVEPDWFEGVERVGITGATSTPRWLMEAVARKLKIEIH
jgi:4-hydroxy-3-methylbut-2-enyl diphosphate reductase